MQKNLRDTELSIVSEIIASRMGLYFPVERWAILGRKLSIAAYEFGFGNMSDFIQWYVSSDLTQDQTKLLASHLTTSETYFWREPRVFEALTDFVFPQLIKSRREEDRSIRIWSAGCSSGEEAYSLAIALHKTIPKISDWNITILATDINPKVLEKAESGIYGSWSFRNAPDWLTSTYFHNLGDRKYEVIPEIKEMVTFSCLSLTKEDFISQYGFKMDLIFCRNVLMYFSNEWVNKVSKILFNSLTEDGWFVVSSSELSSYTFPQYKPINFPGAVLYCKAKNGSILASSSVTQITAQTQPFITSTFLPVQPNLPEQRDTKILNSSTLQEPSSVVKPSKETTSDKTFAIRLLANQGYLSEALTLCNEAIELNKLLVEFYFLKASILQEMERDSEAILSLKQAIYIDPDIIMGHFTLGNLFIGQGNHKDAKRYFDNALGLLSCYKDEYVVPESEGLSVKYIREIIFANTLTLQPK